MGWNDGMCMDRKKFNSNKQLIIICTQFTLSIIINTLKYDELGQVFNSVLFQLISASFGGWLLSMLMQYYKKGQWLKYWIWIYWVIILFLTIAMIKGTPSGANDLTIDYT